MRRGLFDGAVTFPRLVLRWPDLLHDIRVFHAYCHAHGADIAPHGKTTMSPEVFRAQLDGGAWGLTVATPSQALVAHGSGATRILIANEVVGAAELAIVTGLVADGVEVLVLVDDPVVVAALAAACARAGLDRPVGVLVEVGYPGGRAGVRDRAGLEATLDAIDEAGPRVALRGFEAYEGLIERPDPEARIAAVDAFLAGLATIARTYRSRVRHERPMVSAGGSAFIDRVLAALGPEALPGWHLVVRSGVYVTHDSGAYERLSPLGRTSPRFAGGEWLRAALELWARVISRPEPGLAILDVGHREAPSRLGMPIPLLVRSADGWVRQVDEGHGIAGMNDHHAYLRASGSWQPMVGDVVGLGISHPCEAFEKWREIPTIDEERRLIGTVHTAF